MGYRHYVGYIPKKDMDEIMKEVERLKGLIGQPKEDYPDETYDMYDITSYLRDKAVKVLELGKLYYSNTDSIYHTLYANKVEDFSNEDTEFFTINDDKILLHLSYAMQKIYIDYNAKYKDIIDKILQGNKGLTEEEKVHLNELLRDFNEEQNHYNTAIKTESGGWDFAPYNQYRYDYEACRAYNLHESFDYTDKVMCVFAY